MWETWGKQEPVSLHGKQTTGGPNSTTALQWFNLPQMEDHCRLSKALMDIMLSMSFHTQCVWDRLNEQDTAVLVPFITLSERWQQLWCCETLWVPQATNRDSSEGEVQEQFRNYRPDHTANIKLSSVNKTGFSFHKKMTQTFLSYKKNIDAGTQKTLSELLFSLLLFSFPVFLFFVCGECFHESFNAFWSTYGWGASNNTSMLPISNFYQQVTRQLWPPRSCERDVFIRTLFPPKERNNMRDWVGRKIALQSPPAFSRPLERASWVMHIVKDLLAGFARRKTSFLWSMWADITRCFCQAPANTQRRCHNFPFQLIFVSRWKTEADCHSWLSPPCLTLQPAEVLVISLLRLATQHWPQDAYIVTVLLHKSIIQEILRYVFPTLVCWLSSLQLKSLL